MIAQMAEIGQVAVDLDAEMAARRGEGLIDARSAAMGDNDVRSVAGSQRRRTASARAGQFQNRSPAITIRMARF